MFKNQSNSLSIRTKLQNCRTAKAITYKCYCYIFYKRKPSDSLCQNKECWAGGSVQLWNSSKMKQTVNLAAWQCTTAQ